jgi:Fuc2NAc and GlcNAc transferase
METRLWAALGVSFLATLVTTPLMRAAAWRVGLLDQPNERSSHRQVTPRAGGIAIVLGLTVALVLVGADLGAHEDLGALFAGGLLVAGVGLVDDRLGLSPWSRLTVHVIAASGLVWATGGFERVPLPSPLDRPLGAVGPALAVLWVVTVVNFYNFMDGIDGLAGVQGVITGGAVTLAFGSVSPAAALVAAALTGACAAFLVFNRPPATVFLGDAGSGLLGYTLAGLALLGPSGRQSEATLMVAASLWLFLADAGTCLARRIVTRARWHEAHREHVYQRWVDQGASHARVTFWMGLGALILTALALMGWQTRDGFWYWTALGIGSVMIMAAWTTVRRLERRSTGR